MDRIKTKSLKKKREEAVLPALLEQDITELELRDIEKDRSITDLELDILELMNKED